MIGIPAFTKTPSWREKCMRSLRFTDFLVISNLRTFFLSLSSTAVNPRSSSAIWAVPRVSAASVPLTRIPSWFSALNRNFSMRLPPP